MEEVIHRFLRGLRDSKLADTHRLGFPFNS